MTLYKTNVLRYETNVLQEEIEAALTPENEAKIKILNIPNGGSDDKITASIRHKMSNLTTLR